MSNNPYVNGAYSQFAADMAIIVGDNPSTVTRTRSVSTDKFRNKTVDTGGPYTVRIEKFKQTRVRGSYDQQGSINEVDFVLTADALPVGALESNDILFDGVTKYRVLDVTVTAGVTEANLVVLE